MQEPENKPQPIPRIINSRVIPSKHKTLIWLQSQPMTNHYRGWDAITTSISEYIRWSKDIARGIKYVGVIIAEYYDTLISDLQLPESAEITTIYTTRSVITMLSNQIMVESLRNNIVIIDEFHLYYLFMGSMWNGTLADAVLCVGMFLHYHHIVDIGIMEGQGGGEGQGQGGGQGQGQGGGEGQGQYNRKDILALHKITVSNNIESPRIWLVTQFFVHAVTRRAKEINQCLTNNYKLSEIDTILLLNETDYSNYYMPFLEPLSKLQHKKGKKGQRPEQNTEQKKSKIIQNIIGKRLTYADFINSCIHIVPKNTIVILANADIYFTDSLKELWNVTMKDAMYALLRWDEKKDSEVPVLFGPRPDSQDSWIVLSDSIKERTWEDCSQFNYLLGTAGCDNRFTADMFAMKFLVSNPCNTIKTIHLHMTEIRNYNPRDIIQARFYLYVHPTAILDIQQKTPETLHLLQFTQSSISASALLRIKCIYEKRGETYCAMISRGNKYNWSMKNTNMIYSIMPRIYTWDNVFIKHNGIVYNYYEAYIGNDIHANNFVSQTVSKFDINFLNTLVSTDTIFVLPFNNNIYFENTHLYLLHYVSVILYFYEQFYKCSDSTPPQFFMPDSAVSIMNSIDFLSFGFGKNITVIKWEPTTTVYAKKAIGFIPEIRSLLPIHISTLRKYCSSFLVSASAFASDTKKCIVLFDDIVFTDTTKTIEVIQQILGTEYIVTSKSRNITAEPELYNEISDVSLCILYNLPNKNQEWSFLWVLPAGCAVLEFQNELKVCGEFQYFSAICGFNSWIFPLSKANNTEMFENALEDLRKWHEIPCTQEFVPIPDIIMNTL